MLIELFLFPLEKSILFSKKSNLGRNCLSGINSPNGTRMFGILPLYKLD